MKSKIHALEIEHSTMPRFTRCNMETDGGGWISEWLTSIETGRTMSMVLVI